MRNRVGVWSLSCLLGVVSSLPAPAWALFDEDAFEASTGVGSNYLLQSFFVARRFRSFKDESSVSRLLRRGRAKNEYQDPYAPARERDDEELSDFSWRLGYTFNWTSVPEGATAVGLSDQRHSFTGGFKWDTSPRFSAEGLFTYGFVDAENYSSGAFHFKLTYAAIPSRVLEEPDDPNWVPSLETERYYDDPSGAPKRKRPRRYMERKRDEYVESYPNLDLSLVLLFRRHIRGPSSQITPTGIQPQTGEFAMNESVKGPEVRWEPHEDLGFKFTYLWHHYGNRDVDQFGDMLDQRYQSRRPIPSLLGYSDHVANMLSFPVHSFDENMYVNLSESWTFALNMNQTVYAQRRQKATWGGNFMFYDSFLKENKLKIGLGPDVVTDWTHFNVIAALNVIYGF